MSGSNPMLGTGLNLSGILPTGGLMPTMQSAAQAGKIPLFITFALHLQSYFLIKSSSRECSCPVKKKKRLGLMTLEEIR